MVSSPLLNVCISGAREPAGTLSARPAPGWRVGRLDSTRTYDARKESMGALNSRVIRWYYQVLK